MAEANRVHGWLRALMRHLAEVGAGFELSGLSGSVSSVETERAVLQNGQLRMNVGRLAKVLDLAYSTLNRKLPALQVWTHQSLQCRLRVWDTECPVLQHAPHRTYVGHTADVLDLAWSKSQFLLTASMDKTVRLWHISMEDCLRVFK